MGEPSRHQGWSFKKSNPTPKLTAEEYRATAKGRSLLWMSEGEHSMDEALGLANEVEMQHLCQTFEKVAEMVNAETLAADPSGRCWSFNKGVMEFAFSLELKIRALAKAEEQADG